MMKVCSHEKYSDTNINTSSNDVFKCSIVNAIEEK